MLRILLLLATSGLVAGCAKAFLISEIRTPYKIQKVDDLIITNSPFFSHRRSLSPERRHGEALITYQFMVKNNSKVSTYQLNLNEARLVYGDESVSAECKALEANNVLAPQEYREFECRVKLTSHSFSKLKNEDVIASLKVPFKGGSSSGNFALDYKLKIEDVGDGQAD